MFRFCTANNNKNNNNVSVGHFARSRDGEERVADNGVAAATKMAVRSARSLARSLRSLHTHTHTRARTHTQSAKLPRSRRSRYSAA